jgi:diadenosine tetraphosphate (Ap4A) HIT family hydrolase
MENKKMLKEKINQLFIEQLTEWEQAKNNYNALEQARIKILDVAGHTYKVQYNPARFLSSAADCKSVFDRPCFLCAANRSIEQSGVLFKDKYIILINPYPIFPRHFTIAANEHVPQLIASRFDDMLDLAQQLDDYVVFYNGPKSGASAPNHFHFQAGNKGFLPIESNPHWRNALRIESADRQEMNDRFEQIYNSLPVPSEEVEPKMNIITLYENGRWTAFVFPRKKHRPACFSAEGDAQMLITPGAVDMGGVLITPMEKDYHKITAAMIEDILNEVNEKRI